MVDDEILEKVHRVNYILLDELKRVCEENNIRYFLDSGALLGAIRHQDFIPWDDDVDIAFLREDYERFLQIAPKCLGEKFKLVMPGEVFGEAFFDFIPKIVYLPSKINPNDEEQAFLGNNLNHVCLDLFVMDKLPNSRFMKTIQKFQIIWVYGLAMGHRYKLDYKKYKPLARMVICTLQKCGKKTHIKKLVEKFNKISSRYRAYECDEIFQSNCPIPFLHLSYKYDWYRETASGRVKDKEYAIPKEYDKVLKTQFGNYMELPPVEKRIPEHVNLEYFDAGFDAG